MIQRILQELQDMGSERNRQGMARFGITTNTAFGVSVSELRRYGKQYHHNHQLAIKLWRTGYHEAQMLAAIIDDPAQVTPEQMEEWVRDFDSWDICDTACTGLFDKTPFALEKIKAWSQRKPEYEKRAAFSLIAGLACHSKTEPDDTFIALLPLIKREAGDERNFVRKAVSWALRVIGKRNPALHAAALACAKEIQIINSKSARWIASDTIRELLAKKPTAPVD